MEIQLRRYFAGLVAFAFVVTWATAGALAAVLALAACVAIVIGPGKRAHLTRRRTRTVRARPSRDEGLPLVPDEPSLILEIV